MSIRVTQMEFADTPRFIRRRHGYRHPMLHRKLISFVDGRRRFQPPHHPHATLFVITDEFRLRPAARALSSLTQKDFGSAVAHRSETWWFAFFVAPVPGLVPAEFCKPLERFDNVRYVKNGSQPFNFHGVTFKSSGALISCRMFVGTANP